MITLIKKISKLFSGVLYFLRGVKRDERVGAIFFFALLVVGVIWLLSSAYLENTAAVPKTYGKLREGMLGAVETLNPVISRTLSEQKIEQLLYGALTELGNDSELKGDLAMDYKISNDGLLYTFNLRPARWSDGTPITSNDVVFTFNTVLSPNLQSPLKNLFEGVRIDRIDEDTIEFHLFQPYSGFLFNLSQLKIIPQHVWSAIPFNEWRISQFSRNPVTSGPYRIKNIRQKEGIINGYALEINDSYYGEKPFIETIEVALFSKPEDLRAALLTDRIDGTSDLPIELLANMHKKTIVFETYTQPSYFALFFNLQRSTGDKKVREIIDANINRAFIAQNFLSGFVEPLTRGPFAEKLLSKKLAGEGSDATSSTTSIETILEEPVQLSIAVPRSEALIGVVEAVARDLNLKNIFISPIVLEEDEIQKTLVTRNFDALLFGANFGLSFDLFDLWHYNAAGNLVAYQNAAIDRLIEENRTIQSREKILENALTIGEILKKEKPAVFIFSPYLVYAHSQNLRVPMIDPLNKASDYLANIEEWHFKTKRVWK